MHALVALALIALLVSPAALVRRRNVRDVFSVVDEVERLAAAAPLWPSFDPRRIPVEIYDGQTTILFRHPNPPKEFISLSSRQGVWAFPGRHETVTANAPVKLNDVWTATAMFTPDNKLSLRERAGLIVHEMFHVFQKERHPDWRGDELELFIYPFEDSEGLQLRRLESEALRRAADGNGAAGDAACWTASSLELRRERFARMPAGSAAYERGTELNEGLAEYVEARAVGERKSGLPAAEFAAEEIRRRSYLTGRALALLLDRFSPRWKEQLEAGGKQSLDELLAASLPQARRHCELPAAVRERESRRAQGEVAQLFARRESAKHDYLSLPGWTVVLIADGDSPLWPQGFDPLNVQRIGGAEVLHTRFLKLGNDAGAIEMLGRASLTEGAGRHPLFNGVRRLTVAGLNAEPSVEESAGKLKLSAENLKAEFRAAAVTRSGRTLTVQLTRPTK
ncbi:MAG: hypothetical protein M3Q76_05205 [Acidobacteriota bacterium]|nr:hypothetical protein [Acidobacteriota bacterium]